MENTMLNRKCESSKNEVKIKNSLLNELKA